jgi:hypothetical protein
MVRVLAVLIALAALIALQGVAAVPLAGTYTCANGNPGNAYDYGDIGDFFKDLETRGVSAPVTLEIYDSGGVFTSKPTYRLGTNTAGSTGAFQGMGPVNRLTLRAASGHNPVIEGAGTSLFEASFLFYYASYFTLEGLTIRNVPPLFSPSGTSGAFGVFIFGASGFPASGVHITRCTFYDISGPAIYFS